MALTILSSDEMLEKARGMLQRSETSDEESAMLDLVITAIVYKFAELTRDEVLTMLGIELKEPRAFRSAIPVRRSSCTVKTSMPRRRKPFVIAFGTCSSI
jgi:predicted transposase YdaD